jgi:hypothetical protein
MSDSFNIFINSSDRDSGSNSNFHLTIPNLFNNNSITSKLVITLNEAIIPYEWNSITDNNNALYLIEQDSSSNVNVVILSIHNRNEYNNSTLITELNDVFNNSGGNRLDKLGNTYSTLFSYTFSIDNTTNKLKLSVSGSLGTSIIYNFNPLPDTLSNFGTFGRMIGMLSNESIVITSSNNTNFLFNQDIEYKLTDYIYISTSLTSNNISFLESIEDYNNSNIFGKIPVDKDRGELITFKNTNNIFFILLNSTYDLNDISFSLRDSSLNVIELNREWSFSLKIDLIDTEQDLTPLEERKKESVEDLLRILIIQNEKLLEKKKVKKA